MHFISDITTFVSVGMPMPSYSGSLWSPGGVAGHASGLIDLHRLLACVLGVVLVGFLVLLGVILLKFRESVHAKAQKAGGPFLEYALVGLPLVLLVLVAVPALRQQALAGDKPAAGVSVTVIGEDGAWRYAYPGQGDFSFESRRLSREMAVAAHQPYGFAVTAPLVVPAGQTIHLTLTSADMLYSWSVPALGVRGVAAPGQLTHVWFQTGAPGLYYGLCSALCGDHAEEMPVVVRVVTEDVYQRWLRQALRFYRRKGTAESEIESHLAGRAS